MTKIKHRMGKFKGGYNYRGYCIYRDGRNWFCKYESDDAREYIRTLRDFRNLVDRRERKAAWHANR